MDMSLRLVMLRCFTIVSLIWIRASTGEQQLCHNMKPETGSVVKLNMDTTQIIQQNGMCSCKLTVNNGARISMFPSISSPNCTTNIELIDVPVPYTFVCRNENINSPTTTFPYNNDHTTGDVFWLIVTSTENIDHSLSGSIQIKSQPVQGGIADPKVTVECYDPNTNSSSTTATAATTKSSTVAKTTKSVVPLNSPTTTIKQSNPATIKKDKITSPDHPPSVPPVTQDTSTTWPPVDVTTGHVITETSPQKSTPTSESGSTHATGPKDAVLVAGVIATVLFAVIIISGFLLFWRCRKQHHEEHRDEDIIPVSETHPTYCGLTGGDNRVYDHVDTPHQDNDYYNMAPTSYYQNP